MVDAKDPDCTTGWDPEGPSTQGDCMDGIDNDGDGWTDKYDPDCQSGTSIEVGFSKTYTCNDAADNDGDGMIDYKDPDCGTGYDAEQSAPQGNCMDGMDNDRDGWADKDDPDCVDGNASEIGFNKTYECNDSLDNDGDGMPDAADPDCDTGYDTSEQGAPGCGIGNRGAGLTFGLAWIPLARLLLRRARRRA
jgi:hypothetical protein